MVLAAGQAVVGWILIVLPSFDGGDMMDNASRSMISTSDSSLVDGEAKKAAPCRV